MYPSEEYIKTLSGRVGRDRGFGFNTEGIGDVNDRLRDGALEGGDAVLGGDEEVNGTNEGMKEAIDDQRLADPLPGEWGVGGEGRSMQGGDWIGRSHFSRKRTTGIKELNVACVLAGELGKVRWITAFACGGGRVGISSSSTFSP